MCSKSDTWIQIIVLAVSYYLKKKVKKFADSFTNSDDGEKTTDIDGKPPQFDLPMSHVVVDTNKSSGYKVILELKESDPNVAELEDVLNKNEDIVIKDTITEDTE
jgi:hypothetical protein